MKVKEFLSRSGREFTVKDVEEDPAAFSELVALGVMSIPVTIVDGRIVRGFDEKALREAIGSE
jgi:glutaredoxin